VYVTDPEPAEFTRFNKTKPDPADHPAETLRWRASGYSNGAGGMCVQVAQVTGGPGKGGFLVRDSQDPTGPVLAFSEAEWLAFLEDADSFRGQRL
jgi:hypothetical protein